MAYSKSHIIWCNSIKSTVGHHFCTKSCQHSVCFHCDQWSVTGVSWPVWSKEMTSRSLYSYWWCKLRPGNKFYMFSMFWANFYICEIHLRAISMEVLKMSVTYMFGNCTSYISDSFPGGQWVKNSEQIETKFTEGKYRYAFSSKNSLKWRYILWSRLYEFSP